MVARTTIEELRRFVKSSAPCFLPCPPHCCTPSRPRLWLSRWPRQPLICMEEQRRAKRAPSSERNGWWTQPRSRRVLFRLRASPLSPALSRTSYHSIRSIINRCCLLSTA
ncbi:hypothetical protein BD626DRAFT_636586 [Schizophyllum amplum]|uniref:Uncharacterized protein n=1 Tax=Schizophyllum amplum TaxID=97359 RepID=A0A550BT36_9AGAR|nr:hypothetical protein BD626DRAFT_636586 [Auriculariopsis ampla]